MSSQKAVQTRTPIQNPAPNVANGILQRKCACGQHTIGGDTCAECRTNQRTSRRQLGYPTRTIPPTEQEAHIASGKPFESNAHDHKEARFGHDFSQTCVHADTYPDAVPVKSSVLFVGQVAAEPVPAAVGAASELGAEAVKMARRGKRIELPHRSVVESFFGLGMQNVEAFSGPAASYACDALDAEAFTFGSTIAFYTRQPDLATVLHEVTHVVQQGGNGAPYPTSVPNRVAVTGSNEAVERAAIQNEKHPAPVADGFAQMPILALKVRARSALKTNQPVHLLPALGSPTKLATLAAGELVAVTEVLAGGLAYRVYVPSRDLTGIVPKHTVVELPNLEHIEGTKFKILKADERQAQSLVDLAKQDPRLTFLAWSPEKETGKSKEEERQEAAAKAKRSADVHATPPMDIRRNWNEKRDAFIEVASDPNNRLSSEQMYQIWLSLWMEEQRKAHVEFKRVDAETRARLTPNEYLEGRYLFSRGSARRDALGPEYQAAADRRDAVDFMISELRAVKDWLETYIEVMGRTVSLQQLNEKAYEIVKDKQMFRTYFAPFIYGAIAVGSVPKARASTGRAPEPEAAKPSAKEPAKPSAQGRPSGAGLPSKPQAPRVLVVGAETEAEFAYARDIAARGQQVDVVNPDVSKAASEYAKQGGKFIQAKIESLPREPTYTVIREDFPFPTGRTIVTIEMVGERLARLKPGGRWVVASEESQEFLPTLRKAAESKGAKVTVYEIPKAHEGAPQSAYPKEHTRFIVIVEKP